MHFGVLLQLSIWQKRSLSKVSFFAVSWGLVPSEKRFSRAFPTSHDPQHRQKTAPHCFWKSNSNIRIYINHFRRFFFNQRGGCKSIPLPKPDMVKLSICLSNFYVDYAFAFMLSHYLYQRFSWGDRPLGGSQQHKSGFLTHRTTH